MRRGIGVQRKKLHANQKKAFEDKGKELNAENLAYIQEQMQIFKTHLQSFAEKHKSQINKDPYFRHQFQIMCSKLGVDVLASNKGFWAELLGVGTFYSELAIQIIHICLATRDRNGGMMSLETLCSRLQQARGKSQGKEIISQDVERAIKSLGPLGRGVRLINTNAGNKLVVSVPFELSPDNIKVLESARKYGGAISIQDLIKEHNWSKDRAKHAMDFILRHGVIWVDRNEDGLERYWFPSLYKHPAFEKYVGN